MADRDWLRLNVFLVASLFTIPVAAGDLTEHLTKSVPPLVADFMSGKHADNAVVVPAMSVAIGRDGELVYGAGFGMTDKDRPATVRSIYMIGSLTKQFTAATVLRLMEKKARATRTGALFTPNMPVADILKVADGWAIKGGPPITVEHLLSMTSNLPNFTRRPPRQLDPWGGVPAQTLLGQLGDYRPSGYPGSFEYSNTSYFLLSELIEAVAINGVTRDYQHTLKDEVFDRLGLGDTGFLSDQAIAARLATPHFHRKPTFAKPDWMKGSGDVASNVIDLFNWDKALIEGRALTPPMRNLMLSDAARVSVWTYYGAGWFITHKDKIDRYFHSGSVPGYTSFNLIVRPSPAHWISVVLLTNSDGVENLDTLADELVRLAAGHG